MGSTYVKEDRNCDYRLSEQHTNLTIHQQALTKCDWINGIRPTKNGRAAIRCSTPDHLPMVGAVPDTTIQLEQYHDLYKALPAKHYPAPSNHTNLFMLCGLGSRGLTTAPLCAQILVSQIVKRAVAVVEQLVGCFKPQSLFSQGAYPQTGLKSLRNLMIGIPLARLT